MSLALHTSPYALLLNGLHLRPGRTQETPAKPAAGKTIPHWTEYLSGRDQG